MAMNLADARLAEGLCQTLTVTRDTQLNPSPEEAVFDAGPHPRGRIRLPQTDCSIVESNANRGSRPFSLLA